MSNNVDLTFDNEIVLQNIQGLEGRVRQQVNVLGNATGQKMQAFAQENAPWTDRTGDARQLLKYKSTPDQTGVTISIFHQVEYGLWLEVAHNEKYAILKNSRDAILPEFIEAIKHIRL